MDELRKKTEDLIKNIESEFDENEDKYRKLNKLRLIKKILENDMCFFQMPMDTAYNILEDLEIQNVKEKYIELVKSENIKKK